ncbi:MAG: hypothetical protein R3A45_06815 [Bdellovibrionota bacterium]
MKKVFITIAVFGLMFIGGVSTSYAQKKDMSHEYTDSLSEDNSSPAFSNAAKLGRTFTIVSDVDTYPENGVITLSLLGPKGQYNEANAHLTVHFIDEEDHQGEDHQGEDHQGEDLQGG